VVDAADPVARSSTLTYVVTATSAGATSGAEIAVALTLPTDVTLESATPSAGGAWDDLAMTWSPPPLDDGESATLALTLAVGAGAPADLDVVACRATLEALDPADLAASDDVASESTSIDAALIFVNGFEPFDTPWTIGP
jgi:hypothetical protein